MAPPNVMLVTMSNEVDYAVPSKQQFDQLFQSRLYGVRLGHRPMFHVEHLVYCSLPLSRMSE